MTVTAPIDDVVLQCKVRVGEYAKAGPLPQPLVLLGKLDRFHVRADVDEKDAWRFRPGTESYASVRGNATERVDTRVLQVIYSLDPGAPVYAWQQMDVFIQAEGEQK